MTPDSIGPFKVRDEEGREIDASFLIEQDNESTSIIVKSAGASKYNMQYDDGLRLLLSRLASNSATILDVSVDSRTARIKIPDVLGRLLPSFSKPRQLGAGDDVEVLRTTMQREQRPIAQEPGALGGNSQKQIRIRTIIPSARSVQDVAATLLGARRRSDEAREAIDRPPLPHANIGDFDPTNRTDARTALWRQIKARQGQPEFRRMLLEAYEHRCAITNCDTDEALEAAHIQPYRGEHTHHVENGLLLRADLHTLFDRGLLSVDSSTWTVAVAPALRTGSYGDLHGRGVRPMRHGARPSVEAIDEHRLECMF